MDCVFHPGNEAVWVCAECERSICSDCSVEREGRIYCPECAPPQVQSKARVVIDYGRAFSYFLDDPEWIKKLFIGGLLTLASFAIIPAFFLLGYQLRVMGRVMAGDDQKLPEWDRMKEMFISGGRLFLVLLCYALPGIAMLAGFIAIGLTAGQGTPPAAFTGLQEGALALFCFLFVSFVLYLVFLQLVAPALIIRFQYTNSFREAIKFGKVVEIIKANPGPYLTTFLLMLFVIVPLSLFGLIACGIGVFLSLFYALLVDTHLYAQLARISPR